MERTPEKTLERLIERIQETATVGRQVTNYQGWWVRTSVNRPAGWWAEGGVLAISSKVVARVLAG